MEKEYKQDTGRDSSVGSYYFIFPENADSEVIGKKLPRPRKTFPLIVGFGLILTSLVFEIAIKPKLLLIHEKFDVGVPVYTRFSFIVLMLVLVTYFTFILFKKEKTEYFSEKIGDGKLRVIPIFKDDRALSAFIIIALIFFLAFIIIAILEPIFQMLAK